MICTLEDHRGNHVEAGLEVLRLAAGKSQEGGIGPGLWQLRWGCKQRERADAKKTEIWVGCHEIWVLIPALVQSLHVTLDESFPSWTLFPKLSGERERFYGCR